MKIILNSNEVEAVRDYVLGSIDIMVPRERKFETEQRILSSDFFMNTFDNEEYELNIPECYIVEGLDLGYELIKQLAPEIQQLIKIDDLLTQEEAKLFFKGLCDCLPIGKRAFNDMLEVIEKTCTKKNRLNAFFINLVVTFKRIKKIIGLEYKTAVGESISDTVKKAIQYALER